MKTTLSTVTGTVKPDLKISFILTAALVITNLRQQPGQKWLNGSVVDRCLDCDQDAPIFLEHTTTAGKVLARTCTDCFEKQNYFNIQ